MTTKATLIVAGMPLFEEARVSEDALDAIREARVVIGESRGVTMRFVKQAGDPAGKEIFFMDPPRDDERERTLEALAKVAAEGGTAVLFSDTGMPLLFDPGIEFLAFCREKGFRIRSVPSATSWGTACALSGFSAPFFVAGFPPRDNDERRRFFAALKLQDAACVLMDTPYRFKLLLSQAIEALGPGRSAFLGWELAKQEEALLWGRLSDIEREARARKMEKGEFVLVVGKPSSGSGRKRGS
jgi:16S rRNA (cytidine1402-2'-O)-methyltransferase